MAGIYPIAPRHSEDPADWFMFSDLLQDAKASPCFWKNVLHIAQSLQQEWRVVFSCCRRVVSISPSIWLGKTVSVNCGNKAYGSDLLVR